MSDGLRNFMFTLVIAGLLAVSYYFYNNNLKSKTLKELEKEKTAFNEIVSALEEDSSALPMDYAQAPRKYLSRVITALKARSFLGLAVFNQKSKESIYQDFIQHVLAFREALISYMSNEPMSNQQKKDVMKKIVSTCETLLKKELADNEKDLKANPIYQKWSDGDSQKFYLRDSELPVEAVTAEETTTTDTTTKQADYSQFNVKDGMTMSGEATVVGPEKKEPEPEILRTTIDFTHLKQCIGEPIEVIKKNGSSQDGKLVEVDENSLTIDIAVVGGQFTMKILKTDIDKLFKITLKKTKTTTEEE